MDDEGESDQSRVDEDVRERHAVRVREMRSPVFVAEEFGGWEARTDDAGGVSERGGDGEVQRRTL